MSPIATLVFAIVSVTVAIVSIVRLVRSKSQHKSQGREGQQKEA